MKFDSFDSFAVSFRFYFLLHGNETNQRARENQQRLRVMLQHNKVIQIKIKYIHKLRNKTFYFIRDFKMFVLKNGHSAVRFIM